MDLLTAVSNLQTAILPVRDLETVVLKAHLMVETLLKFLLSQRVEVAVESLPSIQFHALVILALGGPGQRTLKKNVLRLNELRNDFAHEILATDYSAGMWPFVERWRRSRGSMKLRWVHLAKLRFLRLTFQLVVLIVTGALATLTPEARAELLVQVPQNTRAFLSDPASGWRELVRTRPESAASLPDVALRVELLSAERALVASSAIRVRTLDEIVRKRQAGAVSDEEFQRVTRLDEQARASARRLFDMATSWRQERVAQEFEIHYANLREALQRLEAIAL